MKRSLFLLILGFVAFNALSVFAFTPPHPEPQYPCKVLNVSGVVAFEGKILKTGSSITDYTKIKFSSRMDILQMEDAKGKKFMVFPQSYGKAGDCKNGGCDPMIMNGKQ
jgi:hypothetical protein